MRANIYEINLTKILALTYANPINVNKSRFCKTENRIFCSIRTYSTNLGTNKFRPDLIEFNLTSYLAYCFQNSVVENNLIYTFLKQKK